MIEYKLIRTNRKTLAIYVKQDGRIEVRAPYKVSVKYIESLLERKSKWISETKNRLSQREARCEQIRLSIKEEIEYKKKALAYFNNRCPFFADKMGVTFRKIKVNKANTRWGSCNSKGDISFAYRLIFVPEELIDYVIVHELAHLKEMNHSVKFWTIVENIMPDYKDRRKRLNQLQHNIEIKVD